MTENDNAQNAADKSEKADASALKGKRGFKRLVNALGYSAAGFRAAFAKEDAFRQECILGLVLTLLLPFLQADVALKLLAFVSIMFILVTELLNSGIEAAIDRVGLEIHPLSKYAKDAASCAVLFALATAAVCWAVLLWHVVFA